MKKIFTLILTATFALTAFAQEDGFYRIKNTQTGRYLGIEDTNPANYKVSVQSGTVNVAGVRTHADWKWVSTAPSTVIYVESLGDGKFDLIAQGTSIYELSSHKLPISLYIKV